jgi:hypothetical protein
VDDEINLPVLLLLVGRLPTRRQHSGQQRLITHHNGVNGMRAMERDDQHPKKESGDQVAPKAPQTRGLNALLETVRRKMAYTIRGI